MQKPKMILFDFGQTLVDEQFSPIAGTAAVLRAVVKNPRNATCEEIKALSDELNKEFKRNVGNPDQSIIEVHSYQFQNYLYEYFGLEFDKSPYEINSIFRQAANKSVPTQGIEAFLEFLDQQGIRTGVISNMGHSGEVLTDWVRQMIPEEHFEFIMASSEYVFRKPHRRLFELALRKADLPASDVWYCGDNPVCDVEGAAACGIFPVWYKGALQGTATAPRVDCLEITSWEKLTDIIQSVV